MHASYEVLKPFLSAFREDKLFKKWDREPAREPGDYGKEIRYVRFVNNEEPGFAWGFGYYVRFDGNSQELGVLAADLKRLKSKGMCTTLEIELLIKYTETEVDTDLTRGPSLGCKIDMQQQYTQELERVMRKYRDDFIMNAVNRGGLRNFFN